MPPRRRCDAERGTAARWPARSRTAARVSGVKAFFEHEAAGGIVLLAAALLGLVLMNSPLGGALRRAARHARAARRWRRSPLDKSLLHWINDGLMAIFFFLVGLEIKRELVVGELSTAKQAALPVIAALGGMIVPALIYAGINWGDPRRPARLGHSGRHRHRLRRRRAGAARPAHPGAAEDLPAGARHHRRPRRHHHHRRSSTRRSCRSAALGLAAVGIAALVAAQQSRRHAPSGPTC